MEKDRTGGMTAMAVLNVILGGIGILNGLFLLLGALYLMSELLRMGAFYIPIARLAFCLLILATGVVGLIAGLGIFRLRPWARALSLVYAGLLIFSSVVSYLAVPIIATIGTYDIGSISADGLICAAQTLNELLSRSARHAQELIDWTDRLVRVVHLRETEEDRRLRHTACLLSDIAWRVHPDHRGEQTLELITNGNFGSITHQGRAFVALSVFFRYAGLSEENQPPPVIQAQVPQPMLERARVLGAAFRVAHLISAARPGVLPATHFRSQGRKLMLVFEHRMVDLVADRVGSRFRQLARLIGRSGSIVLR